MKDDPQAKRKFMDGLELRHRTVVGIKHPAIIPDGLDLPKQIKATVTSDILAKISRCETVPELYRLRIIETIMEE